jgi:hypothetical protein
MMTDSNRSNGSEIAALLEERRKFDAWLAALEARRESTPEHVFERVRADYESRMRDVEERLSAHRHSIQQERSSLQARRSLLEAEEQLRRDERAELELRAHVGELSEGDSDPAFKAVDDALAQMKTERESLDSRIAELSALLETKAPEPEKKEEVAPAAAPIVAETMVVEENPVDVIKAQEPTADSPMAESPKAESPRIEKSGAGMHTPGGTFDELAFLSNVVGQKQEPASLLENLTAGEAPLASNVPANTPIKLRTSGAMEQSKTLKCTECGALNYPTEWYCERCGAELAAL